MLYVTAPDIAAAEALAAAVVEPRLAACANILPGMRSIYRWQGALEQAEEVVLLVKTRDGLVQAASDALVSAHPYDEPCVLVIPVEGGAPGFLAWIAAETGHQSAE